MQPGPNRPIEYATKADLELLRANIRADMLEMEVRLQRTMMTTIISAIIAQTAIFGTLITVLKLFT